uniref:Uncharacterized protein n=1 Tax=Borely moumouvirus TaxID=2712067 RepID=A0A6G6AC80_9VIRU
MSSCTLSIILLIIIYALIILLIPIFLDYVLSNMKQNHIQKTLIEEVKKKSINLGKPIIFFGDQNNGMIINDNKIESFEGNIIDICKELTDNACVFFSYEVFEHINDPDDIIIRDLIYDINRISGGDYYIININKHSPKIYLDHNILNIMDKEIYQLGDNISYNKPLKIQQKIQNTYKYLFKFFPHEKIKSGSIKWNLVENKNN